MTSTAKTPEEYIASLSEDRREAISTIRNAILKVLPDGYAETMQYGMITYVVPHSIYPAGYHCKPSDALMYASLASQKAHMSLYLMGVAYGEPAERFRERYLATGKKLDKGVACVRFKKLDDLALDVVLEAIGSVTVAQYLAMYEAALPPSKRAKSARSTS